MRVCGKVIWGLAAAAAFVLAAACGSDDNSGGGGGNPNPGGPSGGGGGGGATGTTITISSTGVSPKDLVVARGTQVTFTNTSSVPHEMASNPHPTHGSCPEIESGVGFINPGQSKQTGNLNTARTCGYHDHNRDFDTTLQGTITIQ
jgi:plastocyanin